MLKINVVAMLIKVVTTERKRRNVLRHSGNQDQENAKEWAPKADRILLHQK